MRVVEVHKELVSEEKDRVARVECSGPTARQILDGVDALLKDYGLQIVVTQGVGPTEWVQVLPLSSPVDESMVRRVLSKIDYLVIDEYDHMEIERDIEEIVRTINTLVVGRKMSKKRIDEEIYFYLMYRVTRR